MVLLNASRQGAAHSKGNRSSSTRLAQPRARLRLPRATAYADGASGAEARDVWVEQGQLPWALPESIGDRLRHLAAFGMLYGSA